MNLKYSFGFVSLLLMLPLFIACGGSKKVDENKSATTEKQLVKISNVSLDTVDLEASFSANLEAYVKNNIVPQMPNRISHIAVEVGQKVYKGQLLVTLNQETLNQSKLQLENRKAEYERMKKLYEVGGISERDWEAQKTALKVNESAYRELAQNTMLLSPISGIVTARNYDNGDMVSPQMPILIVEQIAPLKMRVNISEQYFNQVKKGNSVKIRLDIFPNEVFDGKVALTYPTIDARSRTFDIEVKLPNHDKRLRPGMFARATIFLGRKPVTLVPDIAIKTLPGTDDHYVFVYKNGRVKQQMVHLGELYKRSYNITDGVRPGDKVVMAGFTGLRDGDEVDVEQS